MIGNFKELSKIANKIYERIEDYELSIDTYSTDAISAITNFFYDYPHVKWCLGCTDWPSGIGGICHFSWIENGELHMEAIEYQY